MFPSPILSLTKNKGMKKKDYEKETKQEMISRLFAEHDRRISKLETLSKPQDKECGCVLDGFPRLCKKHRDIINEQYSPKVTHDHSGDKPCNPCVNDYSQQEKPKCSHQAGICRANPPHVPRFIPDPRQPKCSTFTITRGDGKVMDQWTDCQPEPECPEECLVIDGIHHPVSSPPEPEVRECGPHEINDKPHEREYRTLEEMNNPLQKECQHKGEKLFRGSEKLCMNCGEVIEKGLWCVPERV